MTQSSGTIRIVIPLAIRKRNGRPKILPPADMETTEPTNQGPQVLRAVARAWGWRRKLETGAMATLQDIAAAEKISGRFVGRMMRLAYLSPDVLERLVTQREPAALSLNDLVTVADLPWPEQAEVVFGQEGP
jgi:hypothetical protein